MTAHCVTCGDEAIPLRVLALDPAAAQATCAAPDGARVQGVAVELVDPVAVGDVLLVHAGVALRNLGGGGA